MPTQCDSPSENRGKRSGSSRKPTTMVNDLRCGWLLTAWVVTLADFILAESLHQRQGCHICSHVLRDVLGEGGMRPRKLHVHTVSKRQMKSEPSLRKALQPSFKAARPKAPFNNGESLFDFTLSTPNHKCGIMDDRLAYRH